MNREPSTAGRALRGVSLAITLISVVTFATVGYSAYADVNGLLSSVGSSNASAATSHYTVQGNTARLNMSFSVANRGLYPLSVRLSCQNSTSLPVSCGPSVVSIQPGQTESVAFVLNVNDLARLQAIAASGTRLHFNATAAISLDPFASLSLNFDLGPALSGGNP